MKNKIKENTRQRFIEGEFNANMVCQAYENAEKLGGDPARVFAWGCSAGGTLSCGLARRLANKGEAARLKGIMNLAGGTMHPDNVPERLRGRYKAVRENGEGVPIVDRHVMDVFNGEFVSSRSSSFLPHPSLLVLSRKCGGRWRRGAGVGRRGGL